MCLERRKIEKRDSDRGKQSEEKERKKKNITDEQSNQYCVNNIYHNITSIL